MSRRPRRNKSQRNNARRDTISEAYNPPVADPGGAVRQIHFDIVVIQKRPVEGIDRLVDRLLDREQQAAVT